MGRKKIYVLDTSVYLTNADCIYAFANNDIHVPLKVFEEIELFVYIISIIPYIKKLNLKKCLLDNKELLLDQTNFRKEVNNLQIFKEKNINNKEYIFPECYPYITSEYNNVIVKSIY